MSDHQTSYTVNSMIGRLFLENKVALSLAQLESLGEVLLDFAEAGDLARWLREN